MVPDRRGDESDQELQGKGDASKIEDDFQVINKDRSGRGGDSPMSSDDSEVNSEGEESDDDQQNA